MGLEEYRKKRNFRKTPEPRGAAHDRNGSLRFVVQKHDARRLHYDFRLENRGVLKSWAVPNGPTLEPGEKRLAVETEDHPWDYRDFEGVIPEGNYGAGPVIVWDEGDYYVEPGPKRDNDRLVEEGLKKGHLRFTLDGHKLRGRFSLIKMKGKDGKQWLLVKKDDAFAGKEITDEKSVKSGRGLSDVRGGGKGAARPGAAIRHSEYSRGEKAGMPRGFEPMKATLTARAFDDPEWIFEVKWDGYRALARIENRRAILCSRAKNSFNAAFPQIAAAFEGYPHDAVFDGEIIAPDAEGISRFQLLQRYRSTGEGDLLYYAFDLLYFRGFDLRGLPLSERKDLLARALPRSPLVRISDHIEGQGLAFFKEVEKRGIEGIVAKKKDSRYHAGRRSQEWLKIKTSLRQEAVIGGYTEPRGSRKLLGALVLGVYEGGRLEYAGHTGSGFDEASLKFTRDKLERLRAPKSPFAAPPKTNAPAVWVRPELVCEVKFHEWTKDGRMRHPVFMGLREDKKAREVRREKPEDAPARSPQGLKTARARRLQDATRKELTNLEKVFWPAEGYTKGDMIAYYQDIAPVILPHIAGRPQSLNRHPDGIAGGNFFQKDVDNAPDWVSTVDVRSGSSKKTITYVICNDKDTLAYINNLGCIEINVWNARSDNLDRPDTMVFDLDPVETPFPKVVKTALGVRRLLDELGMEGYCKTSGSRGLHVYLPMGRRYTADQVKDFALLLCRILHARMPEETSLERSPKNRKGRVYLDYLQNNRGATMAAPYALRPKPGATVSAPIEWSELTRRLDPSRFTIKTMRARLDKKGDLWAALPRAQGISMERVLDEIQSKRR